MILNLLKLFSRKSTFIHFWQTSRWQPEFKNLKIFQRYYNYQRSHKCRPPQHLQLTYIYYIKYLSSLHFQCLLICHLCNDSSKMAHSQSKQSLHICGQNDKNQRTFHCKNGIYKPHLQSKQQLKDFIVKKKTEFLHVCI